MLFFRLMSDRVLVTGANGCIGAWVVKLLCAEGIEVVAFDNTTDEHRHRLINDGGMPDARSTLGDLTVQRDVLDAAEGATDIIHLAAVADPVLPSEPGRGRGGERHRHRQRVRGRQAARHHADRPGEQHRGVLRHIG